MATPNPNPKEVDWKAIVAARGLKQTYEPPYWQADDYQLVAKADLIKSKRCILSMHKGGGKTGTVLDVFEDPRVNQGHPHFTVIIFTQEKGMGAYTRDIQKFPHWEGKIQLILGSKEERRLAWRNPTCRYFITTYDTFLSDIGVRETRKANARKGVERELSESIVPKWVLDGSSLDGVAFDEFHRKMRTRNSKFWEVACKVFKDTPYCIPVSGSPTSRGPQDLWPVLHLVDRKMWSTYWGYVYTWNHVEEGVFGKNVGDPRLDRVDKWRNAVRPYVSHVTAEMVGSSIQPLRRMFMDITMDAEQKRLYADLLKDAYLEIQGEQESDDPDFIFAENPLTKLHKLRQILICPKALSPGLGVGQGIKDIWDDAQESELTRYNIFTPFRAPIPILKAWLEASGAHVWVLWGGISLAEQERCLGDWRDYLGRATPKSPGILLGTIKYGESWECPESSNGYMLGEEWDPEDDKQAEARLLRKISTAPVNIYYTRFKGTISVEILDHIINKGDNARMMFSTWTATKGYLMKAYEQLAQAA